MADPELVRDLVRARANDLIPGSLELGEQWVELQKALFDFSWLSGFDDARSEALTPRSGMSLYEDRVVDSARVVSAERCRAVAEWLAGLPRDCIDRARRAPTQSPASRGFPESLGASEADDAEPLREGTTRFPKKDRYGYDSRALELELERVRAFYAELLRTNRALLAIRFRE